METRKIEELEFHNALRDESLRQNAREYQYRTSNKKYYSVAKTSAEYYKDWLTRQCRGKNVLDYGCGDGAYSRLMAEHGAKVVGIDISDVSVGNCVARAAAEQWAQHATFRVMDCEELEFQDDTFDVVCESGVLHHVDLRRAMGEIARVVKPDGRAICYEALGHNLLIQTYRRLTPHLRTKYETDHILRWSDLDVAREFFETIEVRLFHLSVLAAVPFRNTPLFGGLLSALEKLDAMLLRIPGLRLQAWMMIFVLSNPRKS